MRVSTVFAAASLILVTASATACSGGSDSAAVPPASTGTSSAATSSSSTPSTTGNAGAASSVKNFNVCTALPAAAASQITGTTFTTTKSSDSQGLLFSCEYDGPNSALLQISIQTGEGKYGFDTDVSALKAVGHPPNPVTGVGDEAFSEPNPEGNAGAVGAASAASYGALFGAVYIQIGGLTYVTADQGKQIVEELHSKL
jgi:hypothetical protein